MRIGIPKEIKTLENRVGMVLASVKELVRYDYWNSYGKLMLNLVMEYASVLDN